MATTVLDGVVSDCW